MKKVILELPKEYNAVTILRNSPFPTGYIVVGYKKRKPRVWGLFYFDGVSEIPVLINTYEQAWENEVSVV